MQDVLEAFAAIAAEVDAVLTVIGSGHIDGDTAARVEALGLTDRVQLIGPLPNSELPSQYRAAHFLLHASWYESQCVAFNEAMACGTVVCSSDVGLAADLGADFCILAERGQPHVLARRVLAVTRDERRYRELQSNALGWCRAHDVRWTANQYRKTYRELAGQETR
jgi:glycosyltransferase involved in cell wall biosynthesis